MATTKKPAAKTTRTPAVKQLTKKVAAPKKVAPVAEATPAEPVNTGIPYHFNVTFGLADRGITFDGILHTPGPIVSQENYDAVKGHLIQHYGMVPEKVQFVTITTLTRLDAIQLTPPVIPSVGALS